MTELASWPTADLEAEGKKWLCGFFMATYGEGEPTDNAVEFYDWIMSGKGKGDDDGEEEDGDFDELLENASLEDFKYIIFGLGNRTYEHYNAIGRRLDKRLRKIGAKRIGERGEGDDDSRWGTSMHTRGAKLYLLTLSLCSLEEDFLAWKPKILAAMAEYFGVEAASAGAQREKRHVPLFDMAEITDGSDMGVYWGEHSVEKPRRWKLQQAGEEDYEIVDHGSGEKYVEVRYVIGCYMTGPCEEIYNYLVAAPESHMMQNILITAASYKASLFSLMCKTNIHSNPSLDCPKPATNVISWKAPKCASNDIAFRWTWI